MASDRNLPENDPDLQLARAIGDLLDKQIPLSEIGDSLLPPLHRYKNIELSHASTTSSAGDLWASIKTATAPKATILTLTRSRTTYWVAAAVILIAFIGFYWLIPQPQLEMVAQSGAEIEVVTLADGSVITLRQNSKLRKKSTRKKSPRSYVLEGEAFFEVVSDPDLPFSVETNSGTVTVLGTQFMLSTWGDKTQVYLQEGRVQFTSKQANDYVILTSGESAQIKKGILQQATVTKEDIFTDWMKNTIVFEGSLPEEVAAELKQHFGVSLDLSQLQDNITITGTLQLKSVQQSLEDLGLVLGGTFRLMAENEYLLILIE
jgi:ferric-dicitrate binding protein FerR (iron transport regulator)